MISADSSTVSSLREKFKNEENIQKYGAKPYFCREMSIYQSTLSNFLNNKNENKNVVQAIQRYNDMDENKKIEFWKNFKTPKPIKKNQKQPETKNSYLFLKDNKLEITDKYKEKLQFSSLLIF
jgi:hypothetical protein